jgi:hypothetical protein
MIAAVKRAWANFRGFDLTGSSVPPMDGPLRPNEKLDAMPVVASLDDVDNLTAGADGAILCSVGRELLTLSAGDRADTPRQIASRRVLGGEITSIAAGGDRLAVAVEGEGIWIEEPSGGSRLIAPDGVNMRCITAMAFTDAGTLLVAVGSDRHPAREWKRDLMTMTAAGSVWRVDLGGGRAERVSDGLAFPSGLAASADGVFVSEAWRHRILRLRGDGAPPEVAVSRLPAYPGRIAFASGGGFWLAMFAPRNPLVEFVLKEDDYRHRMVESIDPAYWIAPALATGKSFLEPIQGGARKKLNMLKPWSPTWSTGLVVRCDGKMNILRSYHSRADGSVHGVTSLCESGGWLFAGAKGSGKIVAIDGTTGQAAA